MIKALNLGPEVLTAIRCQIPLKNVLEKDLFDYASDRIKELKSAYTSEIEELRRSGLTYQVSHLFDAQKNGRIMVPLTEFACSEEKMSGEYAHVD